MADATPCPVCTEPIPPYKGKGRRRKYCSKQCQRWYARNLGGTPCVITGCSRPKVAHGLCPAHYVQEFCSDRHAVELVPCSVCGSRVEKSTSRSKSRRVVCSYRCRYVVTYGRLPNEGKEIVGPVRFDKSTTAPVVEVASTRRGFLAAECGWCGASFLHDWRVTGVAPKCCTKQCARRLARSRQRLSAGRFGISRRDRAAIYDRDDWTCQLCFEPVDPEAPNGDLWSATLDHIIPQSHMLIPDHSPSNLRLAHLWCNAVRGANDPHGLFEEVS